MDILVIALAVIFVVAGLSKASGNAKGLSGTRDVNVPDLLARFVGLVETSAALGLLIGLKYSWMFHMISLNTIDDNAVELLLIKVNINIQEHTSATHHTGYQYYYLKRKACYIIHNESVVYYVEIISKYFCIDL